MSITQVQVVRDPELLAQHACQWLVRTMREHHSHQDKPFVLSLAGGSTPKRLYQLLADLPEGEVRWDQVILVWGDERNVAADHDDSNFKMVQDTLLKHIEIPETNVLAVPDPGGAASQAAEAYEKLLRQRLGENLPVLDCVLLGMGDDVHTASLFPGTQALQSKDRWVVENWVPKLDCWRITFTAPFLNSAQRVAFLISGSGKEGALNHLWHGPRNPEDFPAQLIAPSSGELLFLLDESALGENRPPESSLLEYL